MSIVDLLLILAVFVVCGYLPIHFVLKTYNLGLKSIVALSIGFAPVLIALFNVLSVSLSLHRSILPWAILLTFYAALYLRDRVKLLRRLRDHLPPKNVVKSILIGLLFGLGYWYVAFYMAESDRVFLYADSGWNFGLVAELKNHFPPKDPHWHSPVFFVYHYLTNAYIAGMANLSGMQMLTIIDASNFLTVVSIFVIVALITSNTAECLLIFFIALVSSFADQWPVFHAFHRQISSHDGSTTFFWSLPIFLACFLAWSLADANRDKLDMKHLVLIMFVISFSSFFAKASYVTIFGLLEFFSLTLTFFKIRLWAKASWRAHYRLVASYLLYPVFAFLFLRLTSRPDQVIFFGIETRDFYTFGSWNPVFPFLAVYGASLLFIALRYRDIKRMPRVILLCSFCNFILFFILKHPGYSDLYFAYNAILLNILFIILSPIEKKLVTFLIANLACGVLFLQFVPNNGFNFFKIPFENILPVVNEYETVARSEINEYQSFARRLPEDALIAAPAQENEKFFLYSAFIERRFWNECPTYVNGVNNSYLPHRLFMRQGGFIPDYIGPTPDMDAHSKAFNDFATTLVIDSTRYFNPQARYDLYNACVFGTSPAQSCDSIAAANGWTHVLVKSNDVRGASPWLMQFNKIERQHVTIFDIHEPQPGLHNVTD